MPDRPGGSRKFRTYPAPNAQWSRSIALGSLLDSAHVNVSPKKRSGLNSNLLNGALPCQLPETREIRAWCVRVWVLLLVVMNFIAIENEARVLRNVHPIVYKVFRRIVRRCQPERRMRAPHLGEADGRKKHDDVTRIRNVPP